MVATTFVALAKNLSLRCTLGEKIRIAHQVTTVLRPLEMTRVKSGFPNISDTQHERRLKGESIPCGSV